MIAVRKLLAAGAVKKNPLTDSVAATSVGILNGVPMLDLCYEEDRDAAVDMNVVLTGGGQFIELQATAEHEPFSDTQLQELVDLARGGIAELRLQQAAALGL